MVWKCISFYYWFYCSRQNVIVCSLFDFSFFLAFSLCILCMIFTIEEINKSRCCVMLHVRLWTYPLTRTWSTTNICMMRTGPSQKPTICLSYVVALTCALSSFTTDGITSSQSDLLKTSKNATTMSALSLQRFLFINTFSSFFVSFAFI